MLLSVAANALIEGFQAPNHPTKEQICRQSKPCGQFNRVYLSSFYEREIEIRYSSGCGRTVTITLRSQVMDKDILYQWLKSEPGFTTVLDRREYVQKNDPFKTGPEEDTSVISMMIALFLWD